MKTPAPWLPVIGQGSTTKPKHWSLSSLDYPNPTHAQWMGDRAIIKIVLEFSADLHCCSGRLEELAMLITVEIAKQSWSRRRGDHD